MNKKDKKIYTLSMAAVFAALTAVLTAFLKVGTGINEGYIHFGDSIIYLASSVLPLPFAMASAAVGGAAADILAGAAVWAPFTAVIKALNALVFRLLINKSRKANGIKIFSARSVVASLISGIVTVAGYFGASSVLYSTEAAAVSIPFDLIQAAVSTAVFLIIGVSLDKTNFLNKYRG
ncbi:MAG: TIGR04002 family protein [Ruminococcaceae bacterium]|nr:TIGR04002 family protein [Oscillospiraceae bacterium]